MKAGAAEEPRAALVTGASSGFGAAIARAFGARGWSVALGARRVERLEAVARDVEAAGGKARVCPLDVRDPASVDACFRTLEHSLGPAQVVVSNAGVGVPGLLHEVEPEALRGELETNLLGPLLVARRALPAMLAAGRGDLVFVSSLNAAQPRPFQVGYTAAKAGVEGLARALQMELEGSGVRASVVRPGPARTEMGSDWDAGVLRRLLSAWKRWGILRHDGYLTPERVADAVVAAVVAPAGTHIDLIQINPEAPPARTTRR